MTVGFPFLAMNHGRHMMKESVDKEWATSKCTPLVTRQVKRQPYLFSCFLRCLTFSGPKKSTQLLKMLVQLVHDQGAGQPSQERLVSLFAFCNSNTSMEPFAPMRGRIESNTLALIRFGHVQRLHVSVSRDS